MEAFTISNLAAYSAQVLCLAAVAGVLLAVLRLDAPGIRYALLRATLVICVLLPWLQTRHAPTPAAGSVVTTSVAPIADGAAASSAAPAPVVDWPGWILPLLLMGFTLRLIWLAIGMLRLRRLRRAGVRADREEHGALQQRMGTDADVRYIDGFAQPVTFGMRHPVILLPASLREQPIHIREAVLAHELAHVRRRDWAWVLGEEITRAVFWFHPAMWWLISRIQLAREEVVDALAVAYTGRRRAYVEALMAYADGVPLAPAPAFARKRHLFRRLMLISKEDVMSAKRLVFSSMAMVAVMAVGGWYAVGAFPLVESGAAQILQKEPGPLERAANPITPENPVPRRVHHEPAEYPQEAAAANAWVQISLRLVIDAAGTVAEARVAAVSLKTGEITLNFRGIANSDHLADFLDKATARTRPGASSEPLSSKAGPIIDAAINAAATAAERWRYDTPANPPIAVDVAFFFAPGAAVADSPAPPPPPPPPPPAPGMGAGIRVGGNIKNPTKIKDVRPVYPPDAKEARVQGVVIAEIRVDEQGRVSDARILRSIPLLDQAALDAVRQWEFVPTLLNGAPTPVILTVTIQFTLD
jgi:TonB family protein